MFDETFPAVDERPSCGASPENTRTRAEYRLISCGDGDARRAEAEAFIRGRFQDRHGAHIATFMPALLLLADAAGSLAAAAGFRAAAHQPLFLERYLAAPVEHILTSQVSTPVKRAEIVEVGNFAAVDSRRARILMSLMPAYFLQLSARWIVFTATAAIRGMLTSMGGQCLELATADGSCVAGGQDEWGRYYSTDPRVMAGYLPSARRIPALWRSHHGN